MILIILQIIFGVLLTTSIILQGKGGWLVNKWAGDSFRSKRGLEKTLFFLTIILAILFLVSSILIVVKT